MNKRGTKFLFLLLSATRTVWRNRTMTLLLMVSYALGWLLPVAILSASNHELFRLKSMGMSESERVISLFLNPHAVLPTDKIGDRAQREEEIMKELHAEMERMKPFIEQVTHRTEGSGTLSTGDRIRMIHVNYVPENYVRFFDRLLSGGRWLSWGGKGECVMGNALSSYFFLRFVIRYGELTSPIFG